ncbi:MAG: ATP-binding protein [Gemmatimonadaceae bacterium]
MIRLLTVGQSSIELDGKRLTTESEIVFGMLLYLAARAGDAVRREEAQALFWPDLSHTRGRHCLRQALYRLRQLGVPLRADNGSVGVALGDVSSDYAPLTRDDVPSSAFRGLAVADILPAYHPTFSIPFSGWVEELRSRIGLRIRQGLVRTIIDLRSKGRYREVEPLARACLTADPFNEVVTLALAEATAVLSGNRAEAMAILDRYTDEIGSSRDKRLTLSASILRRRISEKFVEQRYAPPPETPFVGREDVLQLLVEKMQEAIAGRSSIVYLWGDPGIGKTRLLDELAMVAHVQGVRVERYEVSPNDSERPLALFSALLPRLMTLQGAVGISPEAYAAIQRFVDPAAWEETRPPSAAEEAGQVFGILKAAICELIDALADERPLGVLVDDAHWIDARSVEILIELVERSRGRPVMFVFTSREAIAVHRRAALDILCARATVRRLEGLSAAEIETLLASIAEQRSYTLTPDFVRRTVDASAGNPLFVSELATHYGWNGVRDDLPHNLQTLLEKRLDALSPDALLVFQACAVLGEHATVERLSRVLESPMHRLLRSLAEAERASLLKTEAGCILCRHNLMSTEAMRRLATIAYQALYQRAATVRQGPALRERNAAICWHAVHLWLVAKESRRALRLVVAMAQKLLSFGLARDADAFLQTARDVLHDSAAETSLLPLQLAAVRAVGDFERYLQIAIECQRLTTSSGEVLPEARLAEFAEFDAVRLLKLGRSAIPLDLHRLQVSEESPDVLTELALRFVMAADDQLDAPAAYRCLQCLTERGTLHRASRHVRTLFELVYHSNYGRLDTAIECARRIVSQHGGYRKLDPTVATRSLRWCHRPFALGGRIDEAIDALRQSITLARRHGSLIDELVAECYWAELLFIADRLTESAKVFACVEEQCLASDPAILRFNVYVGRAYFAIVDRDPIRLNAAINSVETLARPGPIPRVQAMLDAFRVLASVIQREEPEPSRLARLSTLWRAMRSSGSADIPYLALAAALLLGGRTTLAADITSEYKTVRRERFALPSSIVSILTAATVERGIEIPGEVRNFLARSSATCS